MSKNLTYESIISAAVDETVKYGYDGISLRRIASRLGVKPASIYNHVDGINGIRVGVAVYVAGRIEADLLAASEGKNRDAAFRACCMAYRSFATANPALYRAYISTRVLDDPRVCEAGMKSFYPLVKLISDYGLTDRDTLNFHRALRSGIHGFIELCNNGFMTHGDTSRDESYAVMIDEYLRILRNTAEGKETQK